MTKSQPSAGLPPGQLFLVTYLSSGRSWSYTGAISMRGQLLFHTLRVAVVLAGAQLCACTLITDVDRSLIAQGGSTGVSGEDSGVEDSGAAGAAPMVDASARQTDSSVAPSDASTTKGDAQISEPDAAALDASTVDAAIAPPRDAMSPTPLDAAAPVVDSGPDPDAG